MNAVPHVRRRLRLEIHVAHEREVLGTDHRVVQADREILETLGNNERLSGHDPIVASVNRVDHNRQQARRLRVVHEQSDDADQHPVVDHDVDRLAGSRMVHDGFHGCPPQPVEDRVEPPGEIGESTPAPLVGLAPFEQRVERRLARERDLRAQRDIRRHHAIEDDPTRAVGKTAQVVLGHTGTVGNAVEIEFFVAERPANPFEVADGDAGRKETRIVVEASATESVPCLPLPVRPIRLRCAHSKILEPRFRRRQHLGLRSIALLDDTRFAQRRDLAFLVTEFRQDIVRVLPQSRPWPVRQGFVEAERALDQLEIRPVGMRHVPHTAPRPEERTLQGFGDIVYGRTRNVAPQDLDPRRGVPGSEMRIQLDRQGIAIVVAVIRLGEAWVGPEITSPDEIAEQSPRISGSGPLP